MKQKTTRLFFIDVMRAWAILMMLQGHFIDGLLDPEYRILNNPTFSTWLYFRGITAPVFFTVSGFIFTYLLIRVPEKGWQNSRVKKGIRRGLQLLLIGYLLRMNFLALLTGKIYDSFYLVDVLHCIGLSILSIIAIYVLTSKRKTWVLPMVLASTTLVLFLFEPFYKNWSFSFLPDALANYFTKTNGSVFTIIPWLGYTTIGAFISVLFTKYKNYKLLYPAAISIAIIGGVSLIFLSSDAFTLLYEFTQIELFRLIPLNNYLFIRLGDVLLVFAIFMLLRRLMTHTTLLKIGASTLSIYVIHFVVLYGSFTGLGLYRFLHHQLPPSIVIPGAILFMFVCTYLSLTYNKYETQIKSQWGVFAFSAKQQVILVLKAIEPNARLLLSRVRLLLHRIFGIARN
ncbi:heparan-alpha-glucosaminide N-acetyltransferase domain-containing protein [uncultured Croceitalea sp.]|uniref:heparan-alpha-glucosaminide N-acetyltransferase domain-containing protein n=1 Tax=uncultured Croceitalea sp. TaxID=1798908 RepID=UPI003306704B